MNHSAMWFFFFFSSDIFLSKMNTICCKHTLCFDPFHVLLLHYTFVCVFSLNWKYVSALPFVIQTNNQTADRKTLAWIWSKLSKNEKEKTEKKMLNGYKYKTEVFFFINSLYRNWGKAAPLIRSLWLIYMHTANIHPRQLFLDHILLLWKLEYLFTVLMLAGISRCHCVCFLC